MVKLNDYTGDLLARSWPVQCRCDFLGCLTIKPQYECFPFSTRLSKLGGIMMSHSGYRVNVLLTAYS